MRLHCVCIWPSPAVASSASIPSNLLQRLTPVACRARRHVFHSGHTLRRLGTRALIWAEAIVDTAACPLGMTPTTFLASSAMECQSRAATASVLMSNRVIKPCTIRWRSLYSPAPEHLSPQILQLLSDMSGSNRDRAGNALPCPASWAACATRPVAQLAAGLLRRSCICPARTACLPTAMSGME